MIVRKCKWTRVPGAFLVSFVALFSGCSSLRSDGKPPAGAPAEVGSEWHALFDGKTLGGWKKIDFGGPSEARDSQSTARVEDGKLILPGGTPMTGVVWTQEAPKIDYEIELEGMRVEGGDFFCGLTFPVRESSATLILGGWGGELCGVSSFDGMDASENETARVHTFENGKWYPIRLRVTQEKIEAWLGEEKLVDAVTTGRRIDVRREVVPCKPLGFSTYRTTGALRGIKWRPVKAKDSSKAKG